MNAPLQWLYTFNNKDLCAWSLWCDTEPPAVMYWQQCSHGDHQPALFPVEQIKEASLGKLVSAKVFGICTSMIYLYSQKHQNWGEKCLSSSPQALKQNLCKIYNPGQGSLYPFPLCPNALASLEWNSQLCSTNPLIGRGLDLQSINHCWPKPHTNKQSLSLGLTIHHCLYPPLKPARTNESGTKSVNLGCKERKLFPNWWSFMDGVVPPDISFKTQWCLAPVIFLVTLTEAYGRQGDAPAGFLQQIILNT